MKKTIFIFLCATGHLLQASMLQRILKQQTVRRTGQRFVGCLAKMRPDKTSSPSSQCPSAVERMERCSKFFLEHNQQFTWGSILRMDQTLSDTQDPTGDTLLHRAAAAKNLEAVRALVKVSEINKQNGAGQTPFLVFTASTQPADFKTNKEIADLLVEYGADVWTPDNKGDSPISLVPGTASVNFKSYIDSIVAEQLKVNAMLTL